jgi:adenosylhomocysteine nucleosidase
MTAAPTAGPIRLVCALRAEERAARKAGAAIARVGLGGSLPLPPGSLVGFGLAGALTPRLPPGTLVTAIRVVDEDGSALWEGEPLPIAHARPAVLCAARGVVDTPAERAALAARTGADAVDLESGVLAASGRLVGVVRAISDTPGRPVGRLARAATPEGDTAWGVVATALVTEPRSALAAALAARRALASLERAAASFPESGSRLRRE